MAPEAFDDKGGSIVQKQRASVPRGICDQYPGLVWGLAKNFDLVWGISAKDNQRPGCHSPFLYFHMPKECLVLTYLLYFLLVSLS